MFVSLGVTFCSYSYMEASWGVTIHMAPIHQGCGVEAEMYFWEKMLPGLIYLL